ncbi:MAG: hypothetical protein ACOZAP_06105 [Pseudomonadota bacterium]|jgi:hypothetical protein
MVSMQRRVFVLGLIGVGLAACGTPPDVLPKGSPEQQAEAVHATLQRVVEGLAAGQARALIDQGVVFLPLRWRRQQKEYQELEELGKQLAGRKALVLGDVHVDGRWALIEHVLADGERVGPADAPWFLLYFSGQWRWLPASIMKDQAITGMMDSHFDRLWAGWQAAHPKASRPSP